MKNTSRRRADGSLDSVTLLVLLLGSVLFTLGCPGFGSGTPEIDLPPESAALCESMQVILDQKCTRCHGASPQEGAPDGIRFDVFEDTADDLGAVTMASRILDRSEQGTMPPSTAIEAPVTPEELRRIREWVEGGADIEACGGAAPDPVDAGRADAADVGTDLGSDAVEEVGVDTAPDTPDAGPPPLLSEVHAAVFQPNCASHHLGGSQLPFLGLDDDLLERLMGIGFQNRSMPWITPGDPEQSYLLHKLEGTQREAGGSGRMMPIGPPLTEDEIALVRRWIETGANVE